jgi:PEP-CTERM motif-containing protein
VIEEIGGFIGWGCSVMVPSCVTPSNGSIQIRPAVNGRPDLSVVLASYTLPHDPSPLLVAYEFARPNLTLVAGDYFALFTAGSDSGGFLLGHSTPLGYTAGTPVLGDIDPTTYRSFLSEVPAAVRILGSPVPEPTTLYLLLAGLCVLTVRRALPRSRKHRSSLELVEPRGSGTV